MLLQPAYLPQYVAETMGAAVGAVAILSGAVLLLKGKVPYLKNTRPRTVRLAGVAQLIFGASIVIAAFAIHAEPDCHGCSRDHWGGTAGVVSVVVWILIVLGFVAAEARRWRARDGS